ncbi:3TM-type holin [Aurantivibrio plasticivorans]
MSLNLLGIGDIVKGVGGLADDLFTSDEERLKIALQEQEINASLAKSQMAVNQEEARHGSIFVAGWRPFIGWVGGIALAYQFVLYPLLVWIWALGQSRGWIPCHIADVEAASSAACTFLPPPVLDAGPLFALITGMLGIGGMRSFDKLKATDTRQVGGKKK